MKNNIQSFIERRKVSSLSKGNIKTPKKRILKQVSILLYPRNVTHRKLSQSKLTFKPTCLLNAFISLSYDSRSWEAITEQYSHMQNAICSHIHQFLFVKSFIGGTWILGGVCRHFKEDWRKKCHKQHFDPGQNMQILCSDPRKKYHKWYFDPRQNEQILSSDPRQKWYTFIRVDTLILDRLIHM